MERVTMDVLTAFTQYLTLIFRPIAFFRGHLERPPRWFVALSGVFGCMVLTLASQALFTMRVRPLVQLAADDSGVPASLLVSMQYLGVVSAASVAPFVWLSSAAMLIACDVLFFDKASPLRLLEATATAFYSQLPWLAIVVGLAWVFDAPVRALQDTAADGLDMARLVRWTTQQPMLVAVRVVGECSTLWLHLLFGTAYHAASQVPLPRALMLGGVGYLIPRLIRALP
jgi:hypothetical protein